METNRVPLHDDAALTLDPSAVDGQAIVAPLPQVIEVARFTSGPGTIAELCSAVLLARPYMDRPVSATAAQERAWRETAAWRTG